MRFTYAEAMTDPTYYLPLAKAAEDAGYHAMTIADSIAYPFESDSKYPYTPDGNREFLDGKAFVEAFVLAGALCAVTTTLRFDFFVLKLPIRPPALVAKQAGSLAAVFGNRLGLGVGTSPWPEDYELLGVPFAKRGKRMDECIDIIKGLTSGDYFEYPRRVLRHPENEDDARPVRADPDPDRRARRGRTAQGGALRRLDARRQRAQAELDRLINRLNEIRDAEGRTGPFEIHVMSADAYTPDGIKRLEDKGVTNAIVGFRNPYIMGHRHRVARRQDPPSRGVRGERHREGLTCSAGSTRRSVDLTCRSPRRADRRRNGCPPNAWVTN